MTPQERLITHALAYVGYLEKRTNAQLDDKTANAGSNNWTRFGRDYDALMSCKLNGQPWCAMYSSMQFVEVFGLEAAKKMIGGNLYASCTTWISALRGKGQWIERTMIAKPGDIIFYSDTAGKPCHVGLVTAVSGTIKTVEGNTSSAPGVVANGGCVAEKSYASNYARILGYGRPKYEIVKGDEEVDQATFEAMYEVMMDKRGKLSHADLGAKALEDYKAAVSAGVTDGTRPQAPATRQEAAIMAYRAAKK